ncbi:MAG TPA: transposase [Phycisphaerae bacterium]
MWNEKDILLAGYEDCNDHDTLRSNPVFKLVSGRAPEAAALASQPTLSRFENAIDIPSLWRLHDFFIDDFIRSFARPPGSLTFDLDAWDDPCHGTQQLALFHGFYDQFQYLPLLITSAETKQILWPALRPGHVHAALGADDDLEYLVQRLRQAWPDVVIHVRGDAGFGMPWMYPAAAGSGSTCSTPSVWPPMPCCSAPHSPCCSGPCSSSSKPISRRAASTSFSTGPENGRMRGA